MQRSFTFWLVITFVCALLSANLNAAPSVTAQLERANVMAGETTMLNVIVEGGRPESAETFPQMQGISVQYQSNSQNITSANGVTTVKHILNYSVHASQPGQYTIPPITISVAGQPFRTSPVVLTVTKADPNIQNRYAFLRLSTPKNEVYVGEIFPVDLQLYVVDADESQPPQIKGDGFIVHKQVEHGRSRAQVGNVLYTVITFRLSVSAVKAGSLTLGPAEMNLVLRIRQRGDPNDLFGLFNRVQRRPTTLTSPPIDMKVLPLPEPVPPDFTGGIGTFDWRVAVSPTNLTAGDPITLRILVAGKGNLDNLKLPDLEWRGFRAYPPNSSISSQDPLGIDGVKTFEQVVVAEDPALTEIPSFSISYFDPAAKEYRKLTQPSVPIDVQRGAGPATQLAAPQSGAAGDNEPAVREDIVHIKMNPGPIVASAPPLVAQPWFLLLQAIPLLGLIGATLWRKRQDKLANNPKLRRKLEVQRTVQSGLAELKQHATTDQSEAFFALLFRLLQEQLGERLDLPSSAITEAVLDDRLPRRGASDELIERLHRLFQVSNVARYAPVRTDAEMLSVVSDLEKALHDLQQLPD